MIFEFTNQRFQNVCFTLSVLDKVTALMLALYSNRVSLNATAEREAIEVFSRNLKKLLLAPPIRGQNTLGMDPGFTHGCKLAALDKHGLHMFTFIVGMISCHQCVAHNQLEIY